MAIPVQVVCLCLLLIVTAVLSAIELASLLAVVTMALGGALLLGGLLGLFRPRLGPTPWRVALVVSAACWLLATIAFAASGGLGVGILLGVGTALSVAVVASVVVAGYYLAAKLMLRGQH